MFISPIRTNKTGIKEHRSFKLADEYDGQADEDKDLITIEELSQRLEGLYKDMEHIRRENLLFESFLLRNNKDIPREDEVEEGKKKGKSKKEKNFEKKTLTNEEKYEIANLESEALKKNIDEGRIKSDSVLETLRAILEETDMAITEIRKDAFDFQREILIGGENSRTGKIEAEKIIKYMEEKLRQKDALIQKYNTKKATLESQIFKTENHIRKKEEMGDDLKFIDFHQLQIENKKYLKDITEKNTKLTKLKKITGQIVTKLTNERKNLYGEVDRGQKLEAEIAEKIKNVSKVKNDINRVTKKKTIESYKQKKLQLQSEQIENVSGNVPKEMNYIKQKKEEQDLEYDIRNLKRKIEIKMLTFNKAKKALGLTGI